VSEEQLRAALREADADPGARRRTWRVVQAAYRERPPERRRRRITPLIAVAAAVLAVVVTVGAAGSPGDAVARWVREVLGVGRPDAKPALVRVPGGGRLLVQAGGSAWVVSADGVRRRLGRYDGASWSPRGLFVVAWRDGQLTALEPGGRVRWSLSRPQRLRHARWAPVDGFRIAYLSGAALRVVNGDGTGDRGLATARASVAPSWRPDHRHVLAHVDARDGLRVTAVDSRRTLWRAAPRPGLRRLAWSPDGRRLLAITRRRLLVYTRDGRLLSSRPLDRGFVAEHVAWAPRGRRIALVRREARGEGSQVLVLDPLRPAAARVLLTSPGRLGAPAWSPSGSRLLVPWPEADQWVFLRVRPGARTTAVANIARQFSPGARRPAFPARAEWCCAP
jgi:hypothetical protein